MSSAAFGRQLDDDEARNLWTGRLAHPLGTDPEGAFVAERDGRVIGLAEAIRRERLWVLSTLAVDPGAQSGGAGRTLLELALGYGADCDAGLICSSSDPRALRLYGLAGFSLRPTFDAFGRLDREALPAPDPRVRAAGPADFEALAEISREVRGGPHTSELEFALGRGGQLLGYADRGFAVVHPGMSVWLLCARDREAARALLWHGLELVGDVEEGHATVRWITGEQDWAIEILMRAGYSLAGGRALCVRGRPGTLQPYLPSPPFA
jgi:GNAT superfamily N-acetyltransferase